MQKRLFVPCWGTPYSNRGGSRGQTFKQGEGQIGKLAYTGNVMMETVQAELRRASGTVERETAKDMIARHTGVKRITVRADKGHDPIDSIYGQTPF
jgi:hypothetical protein